MLQTLSEIFKLKTIEIDESGERIPLHSHTSKEQGEFLQDMFDLINPNTSLEVGFAYGISTLFILEKHRQNNSSERCHIVIEPDSYWGAAAVHNIQKEGLIKYLEIKKDFSDRILTSLYLQNHRIQFAYIDTTKRFDIVMQDFYFIDKMTDVGGVVILDDCGGGWPGIQRVARYVNSLPHYKLLGKHGQTRQSVKRSLILGLANISLRLVPLKEQLVETSSFKTNKELGLNYACLAFKKILEDDRKWDWDKSF
ncbi:class I SAM-dependent methyltransferase [Segetibacter aerophilus]|uniref:O-methyltransferase n=1 Tax=Segetibacter aerophilus TaxID=670293 RepID=A0A512B6Q5_9BACT|nr:class I SAM-dependent methyltransferase [Segetibacter aerophilus]GEO07618.1 hypothetical protein SAE01_01140 [Segetibacter aerophilus]